MSTEQPTTSTASPRRRYLMRVGLPLGGLALLVIGFLVGQAGRPSASPTADPCTSPRAAAQSFMAQASTAPQGLAGNFGRDHWMAIENMSNVILQNPQCFDPTERADAQTLLDQARNFLSGQQ